VKASDIVLRLISNPDTVIYAGAASNSSYLGVALAVLDRHFNIKKAWKESIGPAQKYSMHIANLSPSTRPSFFSSTVCWNRMQKREHLGKPTAS